MTESTRVGRATGLHLICFNRLAGWSVLAMITFVEACTGTPDTRGAEDAPAFDAGPSGARRAPAETFTDLEGASVSILDLSGDVAVINFWGTWCLPCRTELPELSDVAHIYAERGVQVIGIAVDSGEPEGIRAFADEYGVDYPIWVTDMATAVAKFGAVGFPFTLLVDANGWVRKEYLGPQTLESLSSEIDAILP